MERRFIAVIDFTKEPENLIGYAGQWAAEAGADLVLITETQSILPAFVDKELKTEIFEENNRIAVQKMRELARNEVPPAVNIKYLASEKTIQHTLTELLKKHCDQLLFIGLRETGWFQKTFIGSTSLQIIGKTEIGIVAIPKTMRKYNYDRMFVSVSQNTPLNLLEFNNLLKFVNPDNTKITFFYLSKPEEETADMEKTLKDLVQMFAKDYKTDFAIYQGSNSFRDIKKVINNTIDEILVIQKSSRLLIEQPFRKLLLDELVYEGETPLIILPK